MRTPSLCNSTKRLKTILQRPHHMGRSCRHVHFLYVFVLAVALGHRWFREQNWSPFDTLAVQHDSYVHHAVSIPDTGNSYRKANSALCASVTSISVPVQFFLAWRIRIFSKSFVLFIVICTLSLVQGGLGFASTISALLEPNLEANVRRVPVADSWLAIAVACDASITAALSYYLLKRKTGMKGEYLFSLEIL